MTDDEFKKQAESMEVGERERREELGCVMEEVEELEVRAAMEATLFRLVFTKSFPPDLGGVDPRGGVEGEEG